MRSRHAFGVFCYKPGRLTRQCRACKLCRSCLCQSISRSTIYRRIPSTGTVVRVAATVCAKSNEWENQKGCSTGGTSDPTPGTLNLYTYRGDWFNCSDPTQPGIAAITHYLTALPCGVQTECGPGEYWQAVDVNPAWTPKGTVQSGLVVPPTMQPSIGDALSADTDSTAISATRSQKGTLPAVS